MFKKALEKDLKDIFKVKKVIFQRLDSAVEHDVLYCEVSDSRQVVRRGEEFARVSGKIGIFGAEAGNPYGFFQKQLEKAPADIEKRFWFGRTETQSETAPGWELKTQSIDFVYFYKAEYYPVKGVISVVEFIINYIQGVFTK